MRQFRDLPFRRKLILVMLGVSVVAVATVTATLVLFEWSRFRSSLVRELTTEAAMIGANSAAALAFDDSSAGLEVLEALRARADIVQAWLLRPDGSLLAQYSRQGSASPPSARAQSHWFEEGHLLLCQPVTFNADPVGLICLRASTTAQRARLWSYLGIALGTMLLALALAYQIAVRLQALIAEPLVALTRAVRDVSQHKDYGLRVLKQTDDEIGVLIDGFNTMLAEIQSRDAEISHREERFRQLTETIQEVFWLRDDLQDRVLYVSPAYERIWGRTAADLYVTPNAWLDGVHPDDRGRVRQALVAGRAQGSYDEEFRVVAPDGTVRWVRDRSFPVRSPDGRVYRIAGIAEDITERKRLERDILDISEREQRRIGQDIHDGLCQHLVGIGFVVKLLQTKLAKAQPELLAQAHELETLIQQAVTQARNLSHGLSPLRLEKGGLELALQELSTSVTRLFGVNCEFDCPYPVEVEENVVATHLYRIAQEAINNAIRHAQASCIQIRLAQQDSQVQLQIDDDGLGINLPDGQNKGIGLQVMRSRARMIGGTLHIGRRSQTGGTTVSCICSI